MSFGGIIFTMTPPKNTLNDLTGGEWLFRSKSVIKGNFGNGSMAHSIRRAANKSPELKTIEVFTKPAILLILLRAELYLEHSLQIELVSDVSLMNFKLLLIKRLVKKSELFDDLPEAITEFF